MYNKPIYKYSTGIYTKYSRPLPTYVYCLEYSSYTILVVRNWSVLFIYLVSIRRVKVLRDIIFTPDINPANAAKESDSITWNGSMFSINKETTYISNISAYDTGMQCVACNRLVTNIFLDLFYDQGC